jgi:hypothetical protein
MPTVKYNPHHAGNTPEERIASRLRNSGGEEADHIVKKGEGPTRTVTNIHHGGTARQHGGDATGVGIDGRTRGSANPKGEL